MDKLKQADRLKKYGFNKTKTKTKQPKKGKERIPWPGVEPQTSYMLSHLQVYCATSANAKQ